ncbi:uncharacterized protein LOC113363684 [Ctenocephalides felis]|uniref:uncharacterized protein LOC113363684 n=1 Tax=Ctenocephalides felis TaxID=7515 RepID=UPI000E6E39C4|nr:uncharacterized protein LOC113363684 [Ctenocephalides felis]
MLSKQVAVKPKPSIFRRLDVDSNSRQASIESNLSTTSSASVFNRLGKLEDEPPKPKTRTIITAQSTSIKTVKTTKQPLRLIKTLPKSMIADQPKVSTKERIILPNKKAAVSFSDDVLVKTIKPKGIMKKTGNTDIVNKQYKNNIKARLGLNAKRSDANKSFVRTKTTIGTSIKPKFTQGKLFSDRQSFSKKGVFNRLG